MRKSESTALVVPKKGTQLANYLDLEDKARTYAANALSERTQVEYSKCWAQFADWCRDNDEIAIPADAKTLALYLTWLADGKQNAGKRGTRWAEGHKVSNSYVQTTISAIKNKHKTAGQKLDMENPALAQIMDGIRRTLGQSAKSNRVNPITADDLKDMILACRQDNPREARDAAILAVGFGACRRRSEVVTLDYEERTTGRGTLSIDETKGVIIRLAVSKTNQGGDAEEYVIPKIHARLLCDVIKNWIDLADIKKGEPIFRGMNTGGYSENQQSGYKGIYWNKGSQRWQVRGLTGAFSELADAIEACKEETGRLPERAKRVKDQLADRMDGKQVAVLIKKHYKRLKMKQTGKKKPRPEELEKIANQVAKVSGHSLRVGHITTAAENGVPTHQIQMSSGHKSPGMISEYTRVTDKVNKSSLKGMGL